MTFEADSKRYIFKMREIWYADRPYADVNGVDIVQFYFSKAPPSAGGFTERKSSIATIKLDRPMEQIYRNFNRNTQKEIRRARREGFTTEINSGYADFIALWDSFMEFKKIRRYALTEQMLNMHRPHILVNIRDGSGRILAADYACVSGNTTYMLYIVNAIGSIDGPDTRDKVSMASRLAHYVMIEEAIKAGSQRIVMGSLGNFENTDNVRFKESFGTEREGVTAYIKIYNPLLRILYRMR